MINMSRDPDYHINKVKYASSLFKPNDRAGFVKRKYYSKKKLNGKPFSQMIKDKTILDIIDKLRIKTDFEKAEVIDYWDGDLCAIGIKRNDRMVYISTFNFSEGKVNEYDYDFELLNEEQIDKLNVVKEVRNATEQELIGDLKQFLGI